MAHHGGARDLAEGADMGQARGTVTGLEGHLVLGMLLQPRDDLARLLERPSTGILGDLAQRGGFSFDSGHRRLQARTLETATFGVNRNAGRNGPPARGWHALPPRIFSLRPKEKAPRKSGP